MFKNISLKLHNPPWNSSLTSTIFELEKLREKRLGGPVPPYIFFQLKEIFQILESLGSARIEGNNTTLTDLIDKVIDDPKKVKKADEKLQEIRNIEETIDFIEKNVRNDTKFERAFISEIHKILVKDLTPPPNGEGSRKPGEIRSEPALIKGSQHTPPPAVKVSENFDELMDFVNQPLNTQNHLLAIALSHHRMAWVHPFDNGNGRLVRMFTYALLIKQGFQVKSGRILNPTAIFCMDRNLYYDKLALADTGQENNTLEWCRYVLEGLKTEIEKIDNLLDLEYTVNTILLPMLEIALDREHITKEEYEILKSTIKSNEMCMKSADLNEIIGEESPTQRWRIIKKLKNKGMLIPIKENGRIYTVGFANNYLLRAIAQVLEENGFIPASLTYKTTKKDVS